MTASDHGLDDAVLYRLKFARRLPASLSALTGPVHGVIELPLHVAWSGLRAFDLDQPRQRMGLYRTVLAEGTREDLCRFLNAELLASLWPVLRTLAGPSVREVWEEAFPQLQEKTAV
ncbi:transcriptional regulator [Streptomyces sp. DSM 116496]|uniref:transcriptional regulator n=1 Tax=Streptomyces stoeckheimensis TaxID=3344656 RepID=UPI0038B3CB03